MKNSTSTFIFHLCRIDNVLASAGTICVKGSVESVEAIKKFRSAVAKFLVELDAIDSIGEGSAYPYLATCCASILMYDFTLAGVSRERLIPSTISSDNSEDRGRQKQNRFLNFNAIKNMILRDRRDPSVLSGEGISNFPFSVFSDYPRGCIRLFR